MLPKSKLVKIPAQSLVIHAQHPAADLHPDILSRLIDIYVDDDIARRRLTKRALLLMTEVTPINIVGSPTKPLVISGWSLSIALKSYNVEDSIPCLLRRKLSEYTINEITLTDFFFSSSSIEKHDEISHRIKAICMHEQIKDADLRELISPDAIAPQKFFSLPERRRDTLPKAIENETLAVRDFISIADKPLGAGSKLDESQEGTCVINTISASSTENPEILPAPESSPNTENSHSIQNSLFQNEDK